MSRRKAIETAFNRLPILAKRKEFLQAAITVFANMDCSGPGTTPVKFSIIGPKRTKKELDKIASCVEALEKSINAMHQPAILVMAEIGLCNVRLEIPESLRYIASQIRQLDMSKMPDIPKGGKPTNNRAHAIGSLLAYYYHMLTGKNPGRRINAYSDDCTPSGPFMTLVNEVFAAMDLSVNTEDIAKAAAARHKAAVKATPSS